MSNTLTTPVLFIVFNRPSLTQKVFDAITLAKPSTLYVACDGPRLHKGDYEAQLVAHVREIVSRITWPCMVRTKYSQINLGCGKSVSQALDWVFEKEEQVIVLEDDCLPHQDFFSFCQELLSRYAQDLRVGAINGTSLISRAEPNLKDYTTDDYIFSKTMCVWGWAIWKRTWQNYSFTMPMWKQLRAQRVLERYWILKRTYDHVRIHLELILSGQVDSWDFQLVVALALQNQLIIQPARNLITNIGAGLDAHHNKVKTKLNGIASTHLDWPLKHPDKLTHHSYLDYLVERYYTQPVIMIRLKQLVYKRIKRFL